MLIKSFCYFDVVYFLQSELLHLLFCLEADNDKKKLFALIPESDIRSADEIIGPYLKTFLFFLNGSARESAESQQS